MTSKYESCSIEELRTALQNLFMSSDLTDKDIEEMHSILTVLREKAPFPHPHSAEEMWEQFKAEHAEELENLGKRQ